MAMVSADGSSQSFGGLTAQIGWFGLTLAMTLSWLLLLLLLLLLLKRLARRRTASSCNASQLPSFFKQICHPGNCLHDRLHLNVIVIPPSLTDCGIPQFTPSLRSEQNGTAPL